MRDTDKKKNRSKSKTKTNIACRQIRWYRSIIPATQKDEVEGLHVQGQSGTLSQNKKAQENVVR